jgi:hypothetical protein
MASDNLSQIQEEIIKKVDDLKQTSEWIAFTNVFEELLEAYCEETKDIESEHDANMKIDKDAWNEAAARKEELQSKLKEMETFANTDIKITYSDCLGGLIEIVKHNATLERTAGQMLGEDFGKTLIIGLNTIIQMTQRDMGKLKQFQDEYQPILQEIKDLESKQREAALMMNQKRTYFDKKMCENLKKKYSIMLFNSMPPVVKEVIEKCFEMIETWNNFTGKKCPQCKGIRYITTYCLEPAMHMYSGRSTIYWEDNWYCLTSYAKPYFLPTDIITIDDFFYGYVCCDMEIFWVQKPLSIAPLKPRK